MGRQLERFGGCGEFAETQQGIAETAVQRCFGWRDSDFLTEQLACAGILTDFIYPQSGRSQVRSVVIPIGRATVRKIFEHCGSFHDLSRKDCEMPAYLARYENDAHH
jgi:hypothetical protein